MKTIRIQSKVTITVTAGLQYKDMTNPDAHVPDRLKVSAEWTKNTVQILEGVGEYPEEIISWPSVKALIKDKILTVQTISNEEVEETVEEPKATRRRKQTLEEVVEG